MKNTALKPAAVLAAALLALTGCGVGEEEAAPAPSSSIAETQETETQEEDTEPDNGSETPGMEFYSEEGEWINTEGEPFEEHEAFPVGDVGPYAEAPNGELWGIRNTADVDELVTRDRAVEYPGHLAPPIDCHSEWSEAAVFWARDYADADHDLPTGVLEYGHDGPRTEGPTCFAGEETGGLEGDYRLIHSVCQAPGTTTSTLIAPASGGDKVWTPEFSAEERECITFREEVRAFATELID